MTNQPNTTASRLPYDHWIIAYVLLSGIHLAARLRDFQLLGDVTKPFLMILLAGYFFKQTRYHYTKFARFIFIGLLLSCVGDTLLIKDHQLFFLAGLGAFLLAQVAYTLAFFRYRRVSPKPFIWLSLLTYVFMLRFNQYLIDYVPSAMSLPIILYSLAIATMVVAAWQLKSQLPLLHYLLLLWGVLLFMVSDSVLAISQFTTLTIPAASFIVMLTYLSAQGLIAYAAKEANKLLPHV